MEKSSKVVLILCILVGAFLIRSLGSVNIPIRQLTDPDGYFYYWQAQRISEHGRLPDRDMHRWLPLGRDLGQTLNLYPYVLAYAHKGGTLLFPKLSLYQVTFYTPVVCFCIGLGILCLFLLSTFGRIFVLKVGLFLATLPGTIERSTAGLGDRDAWCLMIGILAIVTYLASLQTQKTSNRLLWTLGSGFSVFLGGISWEGFGVFLSIILIVELWRFLSSETEERLGHFAIWVCCFVPPLYLASPAYRNGYGFAEHLFVFMIVPPVVLLGLRSLRHFLTAKSDKLHPHGRAVAIGLTITSLFMLLGYVFIQRNTFADTPVPFSQSALMQSVEELENTFLLYWMTRYGSVFILGSLGVIFAIIRFWKKQGIVFVVPLTLFTVTTFYRSLLDYFSSETVSSLLHGLAIATIVIGFIVLASRKQSTPPNELTYIALIAWFLLWASLAREAKRFDFFIGIPLAFFTASIIQYIAIFYGNQVKQRRSQLFLKTVITSSLLILILFFRPVGGHATRTQTAATLRRATPGRGSLAKTFFWIKGNLPPTAIVAAHWQYGSQLNVLAGVKTIVDQDHYIPHWIHVYEQSINYAENEREILEFLQTHNATHLMLTGKEPAMVKVLRGEKSEFFLPVYPLKNFAKALVKVWEIRYPPDIQPNPKYLKTGIPEIDTQLHLQ